MDTKRIVQRTGIALMAAFSLFAGATPALAGMPYLDNGATLRTDDPFAGAQVIPNIYDVSAVYGKLTGTPGIDLYTFTPDRDGEQTFSLLTIPDKKTPPEQQSSPVLILLDPTDLTEDDQTGLQGPTEDYHSVLVAGVEGERTFNEPFLFHQYALLAEEKIQLKKDAKYYLFVGDQYNFSKNYVVRLGEGKSWAPGDTLKYFGSWVRVQTGAYGGSSPFRFNLDVFSLLLLILGFSVLLGTLIVQETFSLRANRSKPAGYLLVKMQPFSRILIWSALWFMAIGAYIFFDKAGWFGLPFVLLVIFVLIVLNLLYQTLRLSPQVANLEVTKKEVTIPFELRKRWFFTTLVSFFTVGAFLVFLAMYFA